MPFFLANFSSCTRLDGSNGILKVLGILETSKTVRAQNPPCPFLRLVEREKKLLITSLE
jgi:hypothetical protein